MKNLVYLDVLSNKMSIRNAHEVSDYANKVVSGINCIYLPEDQLTIEPADIDAAAKIAETLTIHKLTRGFNEDDISFIKSYRLTNGEKPFFTQVYRKDGNPEVCGQKSLPLAYDVDQTCAFVKKSTRVKKYGSNVVYVSNGSMKPVLKHK